MTIFKGKTIESFITFWLGLFMSVFLLICLLFLRQLNLTNWQSVIVCLPLAFICIWAIAHFRNRVVSSFSRAMFHVDAVRLEDYKQYAKPTFRQGVVGKFYQQLHGFSEDLAIKKQRYDQHAFLVYQLIDQLDTPVLVFNQKDQLSYANGAFSHFYNGQPWQSYRNAKPKLLGLTKSDDGWRLIEPRQQWQISQSSFIDAGVTHNLLVFTNIESALRNNQVNAWRQIISVMGHEIRNSLTPVSSIAESLAERAGNDRDKSALALISERCVHLQDFINRYASVSNNVNLNYQEIQVEPFAERIRGLFANSSLNLEVYATKIWADRSILEQVLINLIKNAKEANSSVITLKFSEEKNCSTIKVVDDGHGFSNLENSFVPLFTTKPEGQGIGLSFCRNIIEQHKGKVSLVNNLGKGVTVTLTLPIHKY